MCKKKKEKKKITNMAFLTIISYECLQAMSSAWYALMTLMNGVMRCFSLSWPLTGVLFCFVRQAKWV